MLISCFHGGVPCSIPAAPIQFGRRSTPLRAMLETTWLISRLQALAPFPVQFPEVLSPHGSVVYGIEVFECILAAPKEVCSQNFDEITIIDMLNYISVCIL